ncbi:uncharacterized protein LOC141714143 [Apium graveolens]|uniref:uncharacterized protein LOC141714143 n=1 Tax=Apium graveolens TaxID=4045 RepID=UPI003D7B4161
MALQYPILFPNGEDGYHDKILFQSAPPDSTKGRDFISMKDYYSYQLQVRENEGKSVILPAGFVVSKRYMQQNFQDALAVCRHVGHPDIFLTMTCNSMWDEIQQMMKFVPGCKAPNCPDIISRVFKLKLDQLTTDIEKKNSPGHVMEKRGLSHVHMLIWLDSASKKNLKLNVDKFVSAEIPDPIKDPVGYAAVKAFMIHGPCGLQNPKSPCMNKCKCIRHFPKRYCDRTIFDESGFPIYMQKKQATIVCKGKADLDHQWVVPFNHDLLVKYQCHMNIKICCHARSLKYLFKYCLKGHDMATVEVRGRRRKQNTQNNGDCNDEIQAYFDGRYVCGAEASYRIFGFPIHIRTLSVERLPFHLPGQKSCTFREGDSLTTVADREKERKSKLELFFIEYI